MHEKTDLPQPGVWHIPGSGQTTITIDLVHEYNKITPSDRGALDRLLRRIIHPASGPCRVQPPMMVEYGVNTTIGPNTFIWLGANVTVLPGVTIGDNAVIGAGSVVTKDIPANAIAMGVPARVARFVDPQRSERDQLREQ